MQVRIFQVDAFSTRRFAGNPAAVMLMERFPADETMQAIADENNLAETAFLVPEGGNYRLRWFTPKVEVPLCGHATLASAAVVMERLEPGRTDVVFQSLSGPLPVRRAKSGYVMDFPSRPSERVTGPATLAKALGAEPLEVYGNEFNYMAIMADEAIVRNLAPDLSAIAGYDRPGVIVTAAGRAPYDCVSRYFAPKKGVPEDPVTGAAHTMLAPYWSKRLGRNELFAYQASRRGGEVKCTIAGNRVVLEGACVFYMEGMAEI